MHALCFMHKLDKETCLKNGMSDSLGSQRDNDIGKLQMIEQMQMHPDKFVRKGPFWAMSKKNQQLQKIIQHANGNSYEPGGREIRTHDNNPRFNYKQSLEEGEDQLTLDEQELLNMQPSNYTIYLRNLAQTVSRNIDNINEVITGLDTTWAGGKNST